MNNILTTSNNLSFHPTCLHISFTPSVPSTGHEDLKKYLPADFGEFRTVESVVGQLDGISLPRNLDPRTRKTPPLRRKRKRDDVHAEDMTTVTPENAAHHSDWKAAKMGRVMRPRPAKPLPPPLPAPVPQKCVVSKDKETTKPQGEIPTSCAGVVFISQEFSWKTPAYIANLAQDEDVATVVPQTPAPAVKQSTSADVAAPMLVSKAPIPVPTLTAPRMVPDQTAQSDITPLPKKVAQAEKLKDLFVREEDARLVGFSLLGYPDLDLELDEKLTYVVPSCELEPVVEAAPPVAATFVTPSQAHITLDPKQPLLFLLPTSFSSSVSGFSAKAHQRNILDVGRDNGWNAQQAVHHGNTRGEAEGHAARDYRAAPKLEELAHDFAGEELGEGTNAIEAGIRFTRFNAPPG
ncbi:hypothetical protein DFH07DRAFT_781786 [Mycena maculata]|uniref:Uncharacterized protein n=1 Tax=Mycena maculata TaxID=230809 RepID=A0AAD7HXQ2_9AGAR|nr:hypothetical protein DFH07DRAFT_781786 [Mycena maculata]